MIRKNTVYALLLGLALILGCAGYGKLSLQFGPDEKVSLQTLVKNWQDYDLLYAGQDLKHPSAVMFDPKDDNRTLTGDRWFKIGDKETLDAIVDYISRELPMGPYYPRLWKIIGPNGDLYGYMFTAWIHATMKSLDESTMFVYDLPLPPSLAIDGGAGFRRLP